MGWVLKVSDEEDRRVDHDEILGLGILLRFEQFLTLDAEQFDRHSGGLGNCVRRFVRRAKELGFSLTEIKELLALRIAPGTTCGQIRKRAEAKIGDIEDRIRGLQRMKQALRKLAAACNGKGSVSECPILDALEHGKKR